MGEVLSDQISPLIGVFWILCVAQVPFPFQRRLIETNQCLRMKDWYLVGHKESPNLPL